MSTAPDVGWRERAACVGSDKRLFFRPNGAAAQAICRGCPVRPECLYDALTHDTPIGVWGGLTGKERRALPLLPDGRSAALNVLRKLLPAAAATAPVQTAKTKTPAPRKNTDTSPKPQAAPAPREDVAELLREGVTQLDIMKRLHVSHRVVAATRDAYGIPRRTGTGFRYSPEQRAENERRTIELVGGGATYQQITDEVGISGPTILAICRKAGLPTPDHHGGQPARPRSEVLAESVEPYGEGHARWTGPMTGRMPQLNAESQRLNARHVVFEQHHGRPPVGRVRSDCGETPCMAGAHLTDNELRRARPKEEPVTVDALKNLLTEIDEQGGPEAARHNRLRLPDEGTPMPTAPAPSPAPPAADIPRKTAAGGSRKPLAQTYAEAMPVGSLLAWGEEHPDPDVQDQAARARAALAGLQHRHAADEELTAITTEAADLEKRLAELRAREAELAPAKRARRKPGKYVRDYDTRTVRDWAAANGVECPSFGQIPKRVLDAWRKTNGTQDGQP
ncbi:WhiB family transcriptional regulator [Streptomyces sp. NBC_00828]|uniref:WhiB family transcriptional regulator n=1 Tax=Streptomyces sp. NBC_00828 TaxID=2903678 RepID=UPI003869FAEC